MAGHGEPRCIAFGGLRVDDAIGEQVLRAVEPGAIEAALQANRDEMRRRDDVLEAMRRALQAARYAADRAFRQYDAADPENRLGAAEPELRWNRALERVAEIDARIERHVAHAPAMPTATLDDFATLAGDLKAIWQDPATDVRLKKRIVRADPRRDRRCRRERRRDRSRRPLDARHPHRAVPTAPPAGNCNSTSKDIVEAV